MSEPPKTTRRRPKTSRELAAEQRRIEVLRAARQHGQVRAVLGPVSRGEVPAQVVRYLVALGLLRPVVAEPRPGSKSKLQRMYALTQQGEAFLNGLESSDAS